MVIAEKQLTTVSMEWDAATLKSIKAVAACAMRRTTKPVLGSVLMYTEGNTLTVTAGSLTERFTRTLDVDTYGAPHVAVCLDAAVLRGLKVSKGKRLRVDMSSAAVTIDGLRSLGIDAREYPNAPKMDASKLTRYELYADYFDSLAACVPFAATSETRPVLMGICHRGSEVMSTDTYRMLRCRPCVTFGTDITVPASVAGTLKTLFPSRATLDTDGYWARYTSADTTAYVRLIEGAYPDLTRIWPTSYLYQGSIPSPAQWATPFRQAASIQRAHKVENLVAMLELAPGEDIYITAKNPDQEYTAELPVDTLPYSERVTRAVNAAYFADALDAVPDDGAVLGLARGSRPEDGLFTLISPDNKRQALVLGVRLAHQ